MLALALSACSGRGEVRRRCGRQLADTAELFTIPQEQMAHVQVLTVQPATLTRSLRLTGAVAYNSFQDHPGDHPGQRAGQPDRWWCPARMWNAASPALRGQSRLFAVAYQLPQGQRRCTRWRRNRYDRAKDLYQHHAIAEQNLEQAESAEVQAQGDLMAAEAALKVLGVTDPDALAQGAALVRGHGPGPHHRRSGGAGCRRRDNCFSRERRSAS